MSSPHLSVATAIEKNRLASDVAFVLLLDITVTDANKNTVEHLYLCRNSENVVYQGNQYIAANFEAKMDIDTGTDPRLQITASDPTGVIRDRMEVFGGGIGFEATLMVVNTGNLAQPPEIKETFQIINASQNGYDVSFTLGIPNPTMQRFPPRLQYRDQCTYQYKGLRCKYAGPMATCDYTRTGPNGCKAHGNEANFGGFPGMQNLSA